MTVMYHHTQRSRAMLMFLGLASLVPIGIFVSGMLTNIDVGARITVLVAAAIMLVSAFVFSSLTIVVRDGQLSWWFGPGVVKKTVPLSTIVSAKPTTTSLINGVGIHLTMRGWLYNVAGRRAVLVTQSDGNRFLIGTDEPERLAKAISTGAGRP